MKINEVNIGNGIVRLMVEPTCSCEKHIPMHVLDEIMKDVIRRKKCEEKVFEQTSTRMPRFSDFSCSNHIRPNREPDGIDVHVDRPLRENFASHWGWANAMDKYRKLEKAAKSCDWPCREPMQTLPNYRNLNFDQVDECDEELMLFEIDHLF